MVDGKKQTMMKCPALFEAILSSMYTKKIPPMLSRLS